MITKADDLCVSNEVLLCVLLIIVINEIHEMGTMFAYMCVS